MSRPAVGHMPFEGHRTVAVVWAEQQAKCERHRKAMAANRAAAFGFEPDSLRERGR